MKIKYTIFFLFITIITFSQDLIVKKDSTKIFCKILKEDSITIYYTQRKDKQILNLSIDKTKILKYFNSAAIAKETKNKVDTTEKIYQAKELKKGFYKKYREFITNSPSITKEFIVKERKALTITRGSPYDYYVTKGYVDEVEVYGFCDGKDIYFPGVRAGGYCKLEYLGPYSFFTYITHGIGIAATLTPDHLVIIDDNGEYQDGTVHFIKKFLKDKKPELAIEYEKVEDKEGKREEFLIKLNEFLKQKNRS